MLRLRIRIRSPSRRLSTTRGLQAALAPVLATRTRVGPLPARGPRAAHRIRAAPVAVEASIRAAVIPRPMKAGTVPTAVVAAKSTGKVRREMPSAPRGA